MLGAALFFVSTFALAATRFRGLTGEARLAAASLVALGVPVLTLVVAARAGVAPSFALVLGAHVALWLAAVPGARWSARAGVGSLGVRTPAQPGVAGHGHGSITVAVIAGAVAVMTALLATDPSRGTLVDPWAHLAWSRGLARALDSYPPAFPALLATLTPFDLLAGAFRHSVLVLHFTFAAQFLALGGRGVGRAWATLAVLVYLLVPAGGRADPPRAELLGSVMLAAGFWVALCPEITVRAKAVALGLLAMMLLLSHVSVLEMVVVAALAVTALVGVTGWTARGGLVLATLSGGAVAFALSPFLMALVFAPARVALVAEQPGMLTALPPRAVIGGLGIALCGGITAALIRLVADWRGLPSERRVTAVALLGAGALLLAPLALVLVGVRVPLQLFSGRLLMASALPFSLLMVLGSGRDEPRSRAGAVALLMALGAFALAQVVRPVATLPHLAAAAALAAVAWWIVVAGSVKMRVAAAVAFVVLGAVVRLWIWTPVIPTAAGWLRAQPERLTVVTNWPATNELDALVEVPVLDGLAGRDANIALHRAGGAGPLHDRLGWCDGSDDLDRLTDFLRQRGDTAAWVVLDPRFATAWQVYRDQRDQVVAAGEASRFPRLAVEPCATPAIERRARMETALRAAPGVTQAFEADGVAIFRLSVGAALPR